MKITTQLFCPNCLVSAQLEWHPFFTSPPSVNCPACNVQLKALPEIIRDAIQEAMKVQRVGGPQ